MCNVYSKRQFFPLFSFQHQFNFPISFKLTVSTTIPHKHIWGQAHRGNTKSSHGNQITASVVSCVYHPCLCNNLALTLATLIMKHQTIHINKKLLESPEVKHKNKSWQTAYIGINTIWEKICMHDVENTLDHETSNFPFKSEPQNFDWS